MEKYHIKFQMAHWLACVCDGGGGGAPIIGLVNRR